MNSDEIRNVAFDRTMRGYRPEEVDEFLARVAAELDKLQEEKEDAEAEDVYSGGKGRPIPR